MMRMTRVVVVGEEVVMRPQLMRSQQEEAGGEVVVVGVPPRRPRGTRTLTLRWAGDVCQNIKHCVCEGGERHRLCVFGGGRGVCLCWGWGAGARVCVRWRAAWGRWCVCRVSAVPGP